MVNWRHWLGQVRSPSRSLHEDRSVAPDVASRKVKVREIDAHHCPQCGQGHLAEYYYGFPPMEKDGKLSMEMRSRIAAGYIVLGGCFTDGENPQWHCSRCHTDFIVESNYPRSVSPHDSSA